MNQPNASSSLQSWLDYIERLHPITEINLGLDRVKSAAERLNIQKTDSYLFTVAGTNGKGTTCRAIEMILLEAGFSVGVYSSPHILNYSERIRINGVDCQDADIVRAFSEIESKKGEVDLTYFEYSTLAALWLFKQAKLDVVILEVGLGGRLDATNLVDADVAVITSISLDHTDYLGDTRELIGYEKAGIFKSNKIAVIGDKKCPNSIYEFAQKMQVQAHYCKPNAQADWEYLYDIGNDFWEFKTEQVQFKLSLPLIPMQNAATAIAALTFSSLMIDEISIKEGLKKTYLTGRFQTISESPLTIIDVAHNPESAEYLQNQLTHLIEQKNISGKIRLVVGMLKDKDIANTLRQLQADKWYLGTLSGTRGASADELQKHLNAACEVTLFDSIKKAYTQAKNESNQDDLIVIFGSFHTVSEVLSL